MIKLAWRLIIIFGLFLWGFPLFLHVWVNYLLPALQEHWHSW